MAPPDTSKSSGSSSGSSSGDKALDASLAELEKQRDAEQEAGYVGQKVDPRPNSAYSLESGPDSPSAHEAGLDAARRNLEELEASTK